MKKVIIKKGYNLVALLIGFMSIGLIFPEQVFATEENITSIENVVEDNEL